MSEQSYHQIPSERPTPPDGCPRRSDWDPFSERYIADPYRESRHLREESPIFYAESLGYVVVNRMDDIIEVFTNPDVYASVNVQDPVFPLCDEAATVLAAADFDPVAVMSNRPEPDHRRIRVFTREGFSNRRLKSLEPYIRQRTHALVDAMIEAGPPSEFIEALAFPLPGETVFRFIGFPEGDDELLKSYCTERKAFSWGKPSDREQVQIARTMLDYWRYCRQFTAHKRDHPGDDFTSELLAAHASHPDALSYREVESIIYGLSFAGHEAVTNLLCNSLTCLLPRREQWQALVDDPSLIPNAVEEVLRFDSSQISWRRITTQPTTLAGIDLPAGMPIFLNFAAANHEPDHFPEPERFDICRKGARGHISFGRGIHFCLGARLARTESIIVLEILSERLPSLELDRPDEIAPVPNMTFRGPSALGLRWDA